MEQRRAGVSAFTGHACGLAADGVGQWPVLLLQNPSADGWKRDGERGLRPGSDGVECDAAQNELPLLRARERLPCHPQGLPRDGRRACRRSVERGRCQLLRRSPGDASGCLFLPRRDVRDLSHRPRPNGCLRGCYRCGNCPLLAFLNDYHRDDGSSETWRRA